MHKGEESKMQDDFLSIPSQDIILTTCRIWANSEVASFALLKLENDQKGIFGHFWEHFRSIYTHKKSFFANACGINIGRWHQDLSKNTKTFFVETFFTAPQPCKFDRLQRPIRSTMLLLGKNLFYSKLKINLSVTSFVLMILSNSTCLRV